MAGSSDPVVLEDYLLAEDAPLLEEMAEEDEEIDLYNDMTFGLDRDSMEEEVAKAPAPQDKDPEPSPMDKSIEEGTVMEEDESKAVEEPGPEAEEKPSILEEMDEAEEEHEGEPGTQLEDYGDMEEEGELGADEHEEVEVEVEEEEDEEEEEEDEQEEGEQQHHDDGDSKEQNDLGDPAVMRAVHGKPTLESLDSAVVDSSIGSSWEGYKADDLVLADVWSSSPGSIPSHRMLEDKAILHVLERVPPTSHMSLDFLGSPVQRGYPDSPGLKRPNFRMMSPKSFPQRFMRQSPMMPRSLYSPRPFTPPRRASPLFTPSQSSEYTSPMPFRPMSPNIRTPTQPLGMRFGPMSPSLDPSLFFSPSAGLQGKFSVPSHMTQLHPQHQRILNQRQQRGQVQSISPKKPWSSKADPYAGLMTLKEKDWVIKVQMMQLQSENPHLDDYYYQAYYHQLERKQAEEELFGGRSKQEPPKLVTPYIQKMETHDSVVRIAGSLGQVAMSTCYSPRRAIDAVHHVLLEEAVGNQRLRALDRIEKMFLQLLDVEETQRKMTLAPEEQHPRFQEKKSHEVGRIFHTLKTGACGSEEEAEDEFLQVLCVRKGKKLTARLLPHLTREQAEGILVAITRHLPFLMRKDVLDESLPVLYGPLSEMVGKMTFSELIEVLQELTRPLPDSLELPLTMALKNQFGISLLYSLLSHGEKLLSSDVPLEPHSGDFEKWTDTVFLVARELSQVPKTSLVEPLVLPSNLLSLFCRYLDKQTIHRLEVKMECASLPSETAMLC
ncbi:PREDICTED: protein PAT1 homolog 2 isoform X2 [Crocodylus porosus]|uniref:protein PAT1 homolog 2 isoform X2 n=1 Tax=Crocodylus porosus TaxID=8502 RepID=UPI00093B728D|nr:PREDICTED: protein PAT1 homolog 2 isoform X2 [Crocodylus porosus]